MINHYIAYFNQVKHNIREIEGKTELIRAQKTNPEGWDSHNTDLLAELEIIAKLKADNEAKIARLQAELKESRGEIAGLDEMIISLSEEVEIKNYQIYQLESELENMDAAFVELFDAYEQKAAALSDAEIELDEATAELNKGWYSYGSKNELIDNGVITKEGGFIGIGKIAKLKDDFNKGYFTEVEISEVTEIPLGYSKVELVTTHPGGAYELLDEDGKISKLLIKDTEKFWSGSKFLVMIVK